MTRRVSSSRTATTACASENSNPVAVNAAVARVIAGARARSCLTQQKAAALTGYDHRMLSRIETGVRPMRVAELVRIADAYETTATDLMDEIATELSRTAPASKGEHTPAIADRLITRSAVVRLLGVTREQVDTLTKRGGLQAHSDGMRTLFSRDEVMSLGKSESRLKRLLKASAEGDLALEAGDRLITPSAARRLLGVTPRQLEALVTRGRLHARESGTCNIFSRDEVMALNRSGELEREW